MESPDLTHGPSIKVPFFNEEYQLDDGFNELCPHLPLFL